MLLTATLLALAAGPASAEAPSLMATATVDRVRLPDGPAPALAVRPLRAEIRLGAPGHVKALARALSRKRASPCAVVKVDGGGVTLGCRSRRIAAALKREPGGLWLDVRELRGLSWDPAAGGLAAWELSAARCPAGAQAPGADCLLRSGDVPAAMAALEAGAKSADWPAAALRLGDLAAARGDFEGALVQWRRTATAATAEGRLARARLCETSGGCLTGRAADQAHDTTGLAEPHRTELELRRIQAEAAAGRLAAAARLALARVTDLRRPALSEAARDFLLELALAGLTARDAPELDDALALYLSLRPPDDHPLAVPLVRAAAEVAAAGGAPAYAARLLSSATAVVPPAELAAHLRRCAQLYFRAGEGVRAQMILRYAREHLGKRLLTGPDDPEARAIKPSPSHGDAAVRAALDAADPTVEQAGAALAVSRAIRAGAGGPP